MEINNNQGNPKDKEANPENNPIIASLSYNKSINYTQTRKRETNNSKNQKKPKFFGIRILDVFQIILALANIGMLIAFISISNSTIEQAKISNEYTKGSLGLAERTAKIELSAYIQVDTVKIIQMERGKGLGFSLTFFNSGRTPAYDLYFRMGVLPGGNPSKVDIGEKEWSALKSTPPNRGYFIGSQGSITDSIYTNIIIKDNTTIPAWKNGSKFLGIYGYVFYKNIFKDTCYTQFSMFYDHTRNKFQYRITDNYIHTIDNTK